MNIQNISNMEQVPQPAKLAGNGVAPPAVVVELPQAATKRVAEQQPSPEQLKNVVSSLNKAMKESNNNLEFSVDGDTRRTVVKLIDTDTGDVIRQFPSQEVLAITRSIDRIQQGLLLNQKA